MNFSNIKILCCDLSPYTIDLLSKALELENINTSEFELITLAYMKWGKSLLTYLNGEFAFSLYDDQKKVYFSARDPLGIKTVYYTKSKNSYQFSLDIDSLLKQSNMIKKPNLKSMYTMLFGRTVDYNDTMYEGVYRLPLGCFIMVKDGKEEIVRYWHPEKIMIDYTLTEEEAAKKLKNLLLKAINRNIDTLDETAFEVSGGLDSSSIVSLLSHSINPKIIDSYSMDFKDLKCDEGYYIDSLLDEYPLNHEKIMTGNLDYKETYALNHLYDINPYWPVTLTFAMQLPMIEKMKKDGKKIIITGQGGDNLFTGSPYVLYDLLRRLKIFTLFKELKFYPKRWQTIKKYIIKPILGPRITSFIMRLTGKTKKDPFIKADINAMNFTEKEEITDPIMKYELNMITSTTHSTILDGNLLHAAESYFGIEFRHPYFDRELVEFTLSLPPEMKYKNRTIKWIFREAMDGTLPQKIKNRKDKAEFSEVIIQQIDEIDLSVLLDNPYIVKLGLIEQSLIDKYRLEYENKTVRYIIFLWTIINVEYWYRYNFQKDTL